MTSQEPGSHPPSQQTSRTRAGLPAAMTDHILQAYKVDIETRTNSNGPMRDAGRFPDAWKVNAHEIKAGVVYKDDKVTVTAFPTKHAMESYGYRFDTPDRRIVISGDTNPVEETIEACDGLRCPDPRSTICRTAPQAACKYPIVRGEVPYDDRTACGTSEKGKAAAASRLPHHQLSTRDCPCQTPSAQSCCGCALRFARNASERDWLAIFRKIRNRKRSRRLLAG
jgi:hypothetical protein